MKLICLGANHLTAPIELRERLTYGPANLASALANCRGPQRPVGLAELAIVSTCNRVEIFAVFDTPPGECPAEADAPFDVLTAMLASNGGLPPEAFAHALYRLNGTAAAGHLCRVAAGLDSMVLGETQVLGQVATALREAHAHGAAGPVLTALFQAAIQAGKRARAETGICRSASTLSSAAVRLAASAAPDLPSAHVAVLGAGEMAELAVEALRARGVAQITVVNRTHERALALAARWSASVMTFESLPDVLAQADIVISSTDAPGFLVDGAMAARSMSLRPARPLVFVDIAVPRDIDPAVAGLAGVLCFDLDDVQAHLAGALAERQQEAPRAEAIAAEEAAAFEAWLAALAVAPLIGRLRAQADDIRRAEVEKTLRRMPQLSSAERQHIEALAESLVSKLLHEPTRRLRAAAGSDGEVQATDAARRLFGLHD